MTIHNSLDISAFIDRAKISSYQTMILIILFIIATVDGLDVSLIAYIGPSIIHDWSILPSQLSSVFGASLLGLMLGSIILGPIADKIGTKKVLIASMLLCALGTLLSARANTVPTLTALRLLTGFGLGGAMPICIALSTEYAPRHRRMMMATLSWSGFTAGIALGALVASHVVPTYGWRWLLIIGGILPLLVLPLIIYLLPESPYFMLRHQHLHRRLLVVLQRISKRPLSLNSLPPYATKPTSEKAAAAILWTSKHRRTTLLLWAAFFTSLFTFYLLTYWMPILLSTHFDTQRLSLITAMLPIGGTVGAIAFALLMDRHQEPFLLLAGAYLCGSLCMLFAPHFIQTQLGLFGLIFLIGFTLAGAQNGLNLVAATIYPQQAKATGIAWAMACGRLGSIIGSIIGALLISQSLNMAGFFRHLAWVACVTALALIGLFWQQRTER